MDHMREGESRKRLEGIDLYIIFFYIHKYYNYLNKTYIEILFFVFVCLLLLSRVVYLGYSTIIIEHFKKSIN